MERASAEILFLLFIKVTIIITLSERRMSFDFHLHDEYLWNENDYVRLLIPKDSIELSLADEN